MRTYFAYFLLLGFLFGTTPLKELIKIPLLIQHFQDHKLTNPNLGVLEFFTNHYFNGDLIDDDYEKDMNLPFKSLSTSHLSLVFLFVSASNLDIIGQEKVEISSTLNSQYDEIISFTYLDNIWQPPRLS